MKKVIFVWLAFFLVGAGVQACPSSKEAEKILRKISRQSLRVLSVAPAPIKGLCEVIIQPAQGGRKGITYIDESGRYLIAGRIVELGEKVRDLTGEKLAELNRIKLSPEEMRKLRRYVAFSAGKGPEIFFIIDPDCPFCKKAERILWELIREDKVRVNVVFFPLERLHPRAKQKAISMICEGKGFEALLVPYNGNKMCAEGKKKVEEGARFVKALGIRGTPTYVLPSGATHSGVLSREKLLELLGNAS